VLVGHGSTEESNDFGLPFDYYLQRDSDLLVLRRADGFDVARFGALSPDLFEVELAVYEDAD
jgi:hypothetical protein